MRAATPRSIRSVLRIGVVALAVAMSRGAAEAAPPPAAPSDPALAETLFREGKALMARKSWDEACPKLQESHRIDPGTGTLLALALCHEGQQRIATAWAEYLDAEALSRKEGRKDREGFAHSHAMLLEPTLSRLTIRVIAPVEGIEIRRDGTVIAPSSWGIAVPIDGGEHVVEATAPQRKSFKASVTIDPRSDRKSLVVPALEGEPTAVSAGAADTGLDDPGSPHEASRTPDRRGPSAAVSDTRRTAGFVVGGAGIVGLTLGGIFGVRAITLSDEAKGACSLARCTDPVAVSTNDDAKTSATIANIGIGAGLVLVGVGAYLLLTSSHAPAHTTTRR